MHTDTSQDGLRVVGMEGERGEGMYPLIKRKHTGR